MKKAFLTTILLSTLLTATAFAGWRGGTMCEIIGVGSVEFGKQFRNSLTRMNLHGDIVYIMERTYYMEGDAKKLYSTDSINFDRRGNLDDRVYIRNNVYTWYSYYFDGNSYALGWNEYDRADKLQARTAYLNDRKGNRTERTIYFAGKMSKRETYKYEGTNLVEELHYSENGSVAEKRLYKYDGSGNCSQIEFYDAAGDLKQTYYYKYDGNGNRIEWRFYDDDENLIKLTTYYYDEHDNVTEIHSFNYDEHVNWKHTYVYEYDDDGNWLRQTIFRNGEKYQIIEREIAFR